MTETMTVFEAVGAVMRDVQQVKKTEQNQYFNFNFRGIDAVMNAVGPALREHGVLIVPLDMQAEYEQVNTQKGIAMSVRARNTYRFYGPAGDFFDTTATGEAIDSGDKGTAKANSVALRTCLLQALCLPTDEPDPDSFSPERAAAITEQKQQREREQRERAEQERKRKQDEFIKNLQDAEARGDIEAVDRVMRWAVEKSLRQPYELARGVLHRMQEAAQGEVVDGEVIDGQ